ncbi:uncharacterized protein [Miscanthus floridulus]|uniref:uncharacterized protein isoform X2 n=1 Tax=Miscanthus floridulus TaxID=154761 RepID=UPI00345AEDF8
MRLVPQSPQTLQRPLVRPPSPPAPIQIRYDAMAPGGTTPSAPCPTEANQSCSHACCALDCHCRVTVRATRAGANTGVRLRRIQLLHRMREVLFNPSRSLVVSDPQPSLS